LYVVIYGAMDGPVTPQARLNVPALVAEFRHKCCEKHKGLQTREILQGLREFTALTSTLGTNLLPASKELVLALTSALGTWKTAAAVEAVWVCAAALAGALGLAMEPLLQPFIEWLLQAPEWNPRHVKALTQMLYASGSGMDVALRQQLEIAGLSRFFSEHSKRDVSPPAAALVSQILRCGVACALIQLQTQQSTFLSLLLTALLQAKAFRHPKVRSVASDGLLSLAALLHPQAPATVQPSLEAIGGLWNEFVPRKATRTRPTPVDTPQHDAPTENILAAENVGDEVCVDGQEPSPVLGSSCASASTVKTSDSATATPAVLSAPPLEALPPPVLPSEPTVPDVSSAAPRESWPPLGLTAITSVAPCQSVPEPLPMQIVEAPLPNYVAMEMDDDGSDDDMDDALTGGIPAIVTSSDDEGSEAED